MSEFNCPTSESDFQKNFAQIKPLMSGTEAYYESSRCLFCYDAPCVTACPTGIDIPLFIRQINSKNEMGAAKTIYESNYFGYACGKVCPTEVLCEGACVYNHSDVKPIEIGRLQTYATKKAIEANQRLFIPKPSHGKRVAIIGAGPAGIGCACELRLHGIDVDVFEARALPSGLTVHGVAPYKITNSEALDEMAYLEKQFGYKVYYDKRITTSEDFAVLEKNYDAIFLGIGLGATSLLNIPGENLENVFGAVEFIEKLKLNHHHISVPPRVIVLGGGNTAMDAASECARMGAESAVLAYRRSKEEMGAYEFEYDLAKSVGVQGLFNVIPIEILNLKSINESEVPYRGFRGKEDDIVGGVKFIRTQISEGKLMNIPGTDFIVECDWVIKATGQSKQRSLYEVIGGLETNGNGTIVVDKSFRTTNQKYFAAGDAVSGGQEVVNALADGKKAAHGIIYFLNF